MREYRRDGVSALRTTAERIVACFERPAHGHACRDAAADAGKDCHSDEMDCAIAIPPNRARREHGELYGSKADDRAQSA